MEDVVSNRSSAFYNHLIKQKIFTNFGLQNRTHEDIEKLKQACLYVGIDAQSKPSFGIVKPEIVLKEIKHTALFVVNNYRNILLEDTFSKTAKKGVRFFMEIVYECVTERLPEVSKQIEKESKVLSKKTKEELEVEIHEALIMNPYELVKMFKAVFKGDYKKHLKEVGYFSMAEFEKYLENIDLD